MSLLDSITSKSIASTVPNALPPLPTTNQISQSAPTPFSQNNLSPSSKCPFLSIIIVNYQTFDLTVQTINSIYEEIDRHTIQLGYGQVEIILVDNDSPDFSGEKLRQCFLGQPNFTFVQSPSNNGFSAGNQLGFEIARGEIIFLLNSDTIILPNSLLNLIDFYRHNQDRSQNIDIAACLLINHDDHLIQPQGGDLPNLFTIFTQMTFLDDLPIIGNFLPSVQHTGLRQNQIPIATENSSSNQNIPLPTDQLQIMGWVGGTAMLFRRDLISKIGFLDNNIFMYGEDVEFCDRAHQMLNHHIAILNRSPIIHYGSASSSSQNAILGEFRGYLYIWRKSRPSWQLPILQFILSLGAILRIIAFSLIKKDLLRQKIYQTALGQIWT